jgi:hypothetical protein
LLGILVFWYFGMGSIPICSPNIPANAKTADVVVRLEFELTGGDVSHSSPGGADERLRNASAIGRSH